MTIIALRKTKKQKMKKIIALAFMVGFLTVNSASAQTKESDTKAPAQSAASTEEKVVAPAAGHGKASCCKDKNKSEASCHDKSKAAASCSDKKAVKAACCASHGSKAEAKKEEKVQ